MAEFRYSVRYKGEQHIPEDVAGKIADSITSIKIAGGKINKKDLPHCNFGYQIWLDDSNVTYCGITKFPGMLAGTTTLGFTFAGLEGKILGVKNLILKEIEGLELF